MKAKEVSRCHLWEMYDDFHSFEECSYLYDLHNLLGYETALAAWLADPLVEYIGGPPYYSEDYKKVEDEI